MLEPDRHCTVHTNNVKKLQTNQTKKKPQAPKPNPVTVKRFILKNKHPPSTKSKSENNICLPVPWLVPSKDGYYVIQAQQQWLRA